MQKMVNAEGSHASTIMQTLHKPGIPGEDNYKTMYLPFDAHLGIALMAPVQGGYGDARSPEIGKNRAIIGITNDSMGDWIGPRQQELNMRGAKEVFDFLGSTNILNRVRDGQHAVHAEDIAYVIAAFEHMFDTEQETFVVPYINGLNAPTAEAEFPNMAAAWHSPFDADYSYIRYASPKSYMVSTDSDVIGAGMAQTITAYSDAPQVKLTIWANYAAGDASWAPVVREKISEKIVDVVDGVALFELSAEDAKVGRYELSSVGEEKEAKSVFFQCIDVATALRSGVTRDNTNVQTMHGFTSKINKDVIELYAKSATGEITRLEASQRENDNTPGWIYNYGAGNKAAITNGAFIMRKVQMEAMPGYTFEYSIAHTASTWIGNQVPASWAQSLEVQNLGPWPNWPVPGGNAGDNGSGGDDGTRPSVPQRSTAVLTEEAAGVTYTYEDGVKGLIPGSKLTIGFATAMNPNDFAIGFNYSEDFSLAWNEDNTAVTVTFNSFVDGFAGTATLYIARLREGNNLIIAPLSDSFEALAVPYVSVNGSIGAMQSEDVSYQVSVGNMKKLATATLWFEVADAFLAGKAYEALNGFDMIGDVSWTQDGEKWLGRVTLGNYEGGVDVAGAQDIFEMTYQVKEALGETEVKLTNVKLSGYDENGEAVFIEAPITNGSAALNVKPYFHPCDINRDNVIDQLDLTTAQLAYATVEGDANWNANADVNEDGAVDISDFILILNNIAW
jgi:hypothetical protein